MKKSVLYSIALGCVLGMFSGATLLSTEAVAADTKISKEERAKRVLEELKVQGYSRDLATLDNIVHIKKEFNRQGFEVVVKDDASWIAADGQMKISDLAHIFDNYTARGNITVHFEWDKNKEIEREHLNMWFRKMAQEEFAIRDFDVNGGGAFAAGWTKEDFNLFYKKYVGSNLQGNLWIDYVEGWTSLTPGAQNTMSQWDVKISDLFSFK